MDSPPSLADFLAAWPLFREAVLCASVAGLVLGYLGVHVVMRRMVFVAATLAQGAGLGVALAFWAGIALGVGVPPVVGATLASLAVAVLLGLPSARLGTSHEAVMAFLWLACSAGSVIVGSRITQEAHDVASILFGTAVLVDPDDLRAMLAVGLPGLVLGVAARRPLVFAGFDPEGARVQGLSVRALDLALLGLVTLEVAVATRALGALPVFAFSVLPAIAALLATRSVRVALPLADGLGCAAGGFGFLAAFLVDLPVGATQAALAVAIVLAAVPVRRLRGTG